MKSVVFMGTPNFAVPSLAALVQNPDYQVIGVLTQPDRPVGRKHRLTASPVKDFAVKHQIKVYQPSKLNHSPEMEAIIDLHPDFLITAAYGQFLPTKLLAAAQIAAINVHGSLLPKYRGGAPIQRAIINGDTQTGISIIYMVKQMDAGDIIAQKSIPITKKDDNGTMFKKLSLLGRDLLMTTLPKIAAGTVTATKQDESAVVFSPNITSDEEKIDFSKTAAQIDCQVRGMRPAPIANATLDGLRTKIYDVTPLTGTTSAKPGVAVEVGKHRLVLACGQGTELAINKLKPAGKGLMDITAYLNGHQDIEEGKQVVQIDE